MQHHQTFFYINPYCFLENSSKLFLEPIQYCSKSGHELDRFSENSSNHWFGVWHRPIWKTHPDPLPIMDEFSRNRASSWSGNWNLDEFSKSVLRPFYIKWVRNSSDYFRLSRIKCFWTRINTNETWLLNSNSRRVRVCFLWDGFESFGALCLKDHYFRPKKT